VKRLLNFGVWLILATALVVERHRQRRRKRERSDA
jgi:hypothetical protein